MAASETSQAQVLPSPPIPTDPIIQVTLPVSTKLTCDNFLTWRLQIEPILDGFGLTKYLDASISPPSKQLTTNGVPSPNPVFLAWHKQDRFLLGWLRTTITEHVLSQYVNCQTARDLWNSLHQVFSAVSTARVMELQRALQTTTRGNQHFGEYFEKMKRLADQLAATGEPVSDSDLVRSILTGLGADFNSFVVAITTRSSPVSFTDLHACLLSHESLLISQNPSLPSHSADPGVFYAGRGRGRGRRGRGQYYSHGRGPGQNTSSQGPKYVMHNTVASNVIIF